MKVGPGFGKRTGRAFQACVVTDLAGRQAGRQKLNQVPLEIRAMETRQTSCFKAKGGVRSYILCGISGNHAGV